MGATMENKSKSNLEIRVIEEDEDFFFIYKPSNVSLESKQEFHQMIQQYGMKKYNFEPRVLFPLEKGASGIAVFAKTHTAERYFYKTYTFGYDTVLDG